LQRLDPAAAVAPDLAATVDAIAEVQEPNGCIPWFPGGQADPWNHCEAAMALVVGGRRTEAERAFDWLARTQRPDGAWPAYTRAGRVIDPTLDSNVTAYIACAAWLHFLVTGDDDHLQRTWPVVDAALRFVVALQGRRGEIRWARDDTGRPARKGLVAGSSSVHLSLLCGTRIAARLGYETRWAQVRRRLGHALRHQPEAFEDKSRWAMDWYYPVLGGVVTGRTALRRLERRWDEFVVTARGVRCVSDRPWVTAAETCELVLALVALGERREAERLFDWAHHLRGDDAAYWTGANVNDGAIFPEEQPTWTSAAVVLAGDALEDGPVAELFRHQRR
jgi:hypothetical protein